MSLQKIQGDFVNKLEGVYEESEAKNIFELVIEHLTGINLKEHKNATFTPDGCFVQMLNDIEKKLKKHEPIQYILNEAWFYDIPFYVDKNVLIPRPETEELVDWVIQEHKNQQNLNILDIGTGSGCIPIVLKRKLPTATVTSCDVSGHALKVAKKNARKHNIDILFFELDFLDKNTWPELPLADIIISNPPYIPQREKAAMQQNVLQYEPHEALFVADQQPLLFYEALAHSAKTLLKTGGKIYVEIHEELGNETKLLFENNGFTSIMKKDMQGKNRMIKCITTK